MIAVIFRFLLDLDLEEPAWITGQNLAKWLIPLNVILFSKNIELIKTSRLFTF